MTEDKDAPKRTAMQVALDAERVAAASGRQLAELSGEVANVSALAEAAVAGDGGGAVRELVKDVGDIRETVQKLVNLVPGNLWAGRGGALATQQQAAEAQDAVLALDDRVRGEIAALQHDLTDYANAGVVASMINQLSERVDMVERKARGTSGAGSPVASAPHVLGLIAQLQKLVYEIGKGRQFRAENQQGRTTQEYDFRGVDDAQIAVGAAQRQIGLIGPAVTVLDKQVSVTEVNKGNYTQVWTTVSVTTRYTFQSTVDGSEWSTEGCGMGRDLGDKAESKALAGAYKYALFHGLNIPVKGVFVDAETEDPRIEREQTPDDGRTYGHGQPPTNLGEQGPRDTEPPAPPADNRGPEELARDALAAVRRAANVNEAASVWNWIYQKQLLTVPVDGVPVGQHMLAAIRLLPGGAQVELPGWGQFR